MIYKYLLLIRPGIKKTITSSSHTTLFSILYSHLQPIKNALALDIPSKLCAVLLPEHFGIVRIDPRHQRHHHTARHVFMQPVQHKMVIMSLFKYGTYSILSRRRSSYLPPSKARSIEVQPLICRTIWNTHQLDALSKEETFRGLRKNS